MPPGNEMLMLEIVGDFLTELERNPLQPAAQQSDHWSNQLIEFDSWLQFWSITCGQIEAGRI